MDKSKTLTFFISIPEPYVDAIFKMANAHNKRHPDRFLTVDEILSDAVCQYVDRVEQMEIALRPANEHQTTYPKGEQMNEQQTNRTAISE